MSPLPAYLLHASLLDVLLRLGARVVKMAEPPSADISGTARSANRDDAHEGMPRGSITKPQSEGAYAPQGY